MHAMTKMAIRVGLSATLLILGGCGNALFFYETGKLSLTLEGRPDSSQPIQGNVGFKQRTVVVSPPMSDGNDRQTDAGSMISSFRVDKKPGWWGPISLETSLLSGRAALCLTEEQTAQAAQVIASPYNNSPEAEALRQRVMSFVDGDDNRAKLKQWLVGKGFARDEVGAEVTWMYTAPTDQLDQAVRELSIP